MGSVRCIWFGLCLPVTRLDWYLQSLGPEGGQGATRFWAKCSMISFGLTGAISNLEVIPHMAIDIFCVTSKEQLASFM